MNLLTERLIVEAHRDIGVCEVTRNSSPEIDGWLRRVGQKPGAPWCAAWAWCKLDDAIRAVGYTNPLPPTASVHRLFELAHQHHAWWTEPGPGYIFGIDHGGGVGHCGIVIGVNNDTLATIEGNTNRKGEREGRWVLVRTRTPAECSLGYLDPGMLLAGQVCSEARPAEGQAGTFLAVGLVRQLRDAKEETNRWQREAEKSHQEEAPTPAPIPIRREKPKTPVVKLEGFPGDKPAVAT